MLKAPAVGKSENDKNGTFARVSLYKPCKEDGNYYYIESPKAEYLLDITAANKSGAELKRKYILVVDRWADGELKVIKFEERK